MVKVRKGKAVASRSGPFQGNVENQTFEIDFSGLAAGPSTSSKVGKGPHPLLLPVILRAVFDFLNDQDLGKAKRVCKAWKEIAEEEKESRGKVSVNGEAEVIENLQILKKSKKKASEFIVWSCNLDGKNFRKLLYKLLPTLSFLSLQDCKINSVQNFYKLMRTVLPKITKFDLGTIKYYNAYGIQTYIKYLPIPDAVDVSSHLVFENLKFLEIISLTEKESEALYLSCICKTFPNLRELVLLNLLVEHPDNLRNLQMPFLKKLTIKMLPHVENQTNPTVLNLCRCRDCRNGGGHFNTTPEGGLKFLHLKMLMNLDLKLDEFYVANVNRRLDTELFQAFLQSQKETLKKLTLEQFSEPFKKCTIQAPSPFPILLPNLKKLNIQRVFIKNLNQVFDSCPNVRDVELDFHEGADWRPILTSKIPPRPFLHTLILHSIQQEILNRIAPIWNNITGLHLMNCTDELLAVIFEKAGNLKTLSVVEIKNQPFSATVFTGLLEEDMKMIIGRESAGVKIPEKTAERSRGHRQFLGSMTGLQHLMLGLYGTSILRCLAKFAFKYCEGLYVITVFDADDAPGLDNNAEFVPVDLKHLMEKEAGYISVPLKKPGRPSTEFARAEFLPFYTGNEVEMEKVLGRLNLS